MNKDTETALATVFDLAPTESTELVPTAEVLPAVVDVPDETEEERAAREDFQFSRGALKAVAVEAQTTLHRSVEVAEQTDTPRAFEAVAQMIRATLDSHKELHALHKTAAELRATKVAPASTTVNVDKGIVFSGGPDELLRLIDPSRK